MLHERERERERESSSRLLALFPNPYYFFNLNVRLIISCFLLFFCAGSLQAQSSTPEPNTWGTNGPVFAIAQSENIIYIGGYFTQVGPIQPGQGALLNTASGLPNANFPKANGDILAIVSDGSGGWYIRGNFTKVASTARNYVAHLLSNGT
ncbi:MAG: hypothetical protein HY747_04690 [Elusimicrobia bacterium]|nr:hypothetical protein [Elusimicrobiota bacterium]